METNFEPGGPHDDLDRTFIESNKQLFEGEATGHETDTDRSSYDGRRLSVNTPPSSAPGSPPQAPNSFYPNGPVKLRTRFRDRIPGGLHLNVGLAEGVSNFAKHNLGNIKNINYDIHGAYSTVVDSVAHANQARNFIEELKFLIISSQLCDDQPAYGPMSVAPLPTNANRLEIAFETHIHPWTTNGAIAAGALSFTIACLARWFFMGGSLVVSWKRVLIAAVVFAAAAWAVRIYMRRQWSQYIYQQALNELRRLVRSSTEFDSLATSALNFILEVELVSRGYRLSLPLPPVSRMENNGQTLKSLKIRTALHRSFEEVVNVSYQTARTMRQFADDAELKLNDIGLRCEPLRIEHSVESWTSENVSLDEAQKTASLRETLKLSRDTRKMFLIGLMSLDATGSKAGLLHYTTALEGIRKCNAHTQQACNTLRRAFMPERDTGEETTPMAPMSPRHAKWKHQIIKVGDMNMSIRSIQAKMALLLEESKRTLDTADDVSELGQMFMGRYDGIGKDIKELMEAWEAGKSSLAVTIDKNERRVSSISSVVSPVSFASKVASVTEEGAHEDGVVEAWDRLTGGEAPPGASDVSNSPLSPRSRGPQQVMETFEAIATPRPRSMLTRQERIQRSQEERAAKLAAREQALQQGWVMGELKDVLKNRGLHGVVENGEQASSPTTIAPSFRNGSRVTSLPL